MKFPAGICKWGDGDTYVTIYSSNHDICALPPSELESAERVARFTYGKGGKKGGGDVFRLRGSKIVPSNGLSLTKSVMVRDGRYHVEDQSIKKRFGDAVFEKGNLVGAMKKHDIQFEVVRGIPDYVARRAISFGKLDILHYGQGREAKKPRGDWIKYVDKIIPRTELKKINPSRMIDGGKAWFVPKCTEANTDGGKGCQAAWIPGSNASFDGEFFIDYWWSPPSECDYCYSADKHRCPPKTVYKWDKERFLEELRGAARLKFDSDEQHGELIRVLRFGKRVDPWMPGVTEESFIGKLEAMTETGTRGVITSKFLPFDKIVNDLFRKTKSNYLVSLGPDEFQVGACAQGRTTEWTLEQALKYDNPVLYPLIFGHMPPGERELRILDIAEKKKLRVQLLPVRFKRGKGKKLVERMTDQTWDFLDQGSKENLKRRGQPNFFEEESGRASHVLYTGELVVKKLHPFWLKLIGKNNGRVRMCHHNDEWTYCGACFQGKGDITPTVHVEKKKFQRWRDREKPKKREDNNLGLFKD